MIFAPEENPQSFVTVHNLLADSFRLSSPWLGVAAGGRQSASGLLLPADWLGSSPGETEHPGGSHFTKNKCQRQRSIELPIVNGSKLDKTGNGKS